MLFGIKSRPHRPGQCFHLLLNILDTDLLVVLAAFFSSFPFYPQAQENMSMEVMKSGIFVHIKVTDC